MARVGTARAPGRNRGLSARSSAAGGAPEREGRPASRRRPRTVVRVRWPRVRPRAHTPVAPSRPSVPREGTFPHRVPGATADLVHPVGSGVRPTRVQLHARPVRGRCPSGLGSEGLRDASLRGPRSAGAGQHCHQASSPGRGGVVPWRTHLSILQHQCCPYSGGARTEGGLATLKPQLGGQGGRAFQDAGPTAILSLPTKQQAVGPTRAAQQPHLVTVLQTEGKGLPQRGHDPRGRRARTTSWAVWRPARVPAVGL